MPLKFINLCYDFVLFFASSPMRSPFLRLSDINVCQCCQYSLMLLSVCENPQQTYNNINEYLTAHLPQTCQRELQGFALLNPRRRVLVVLHRHFLSPQCRHDCVLVVLNSQRSNTSLTFVYVRKHLNIQEAFSSEQKRTTRLNMQIYLVGRRKLQQP